MSDVSAELPETLIGSVDDGLLEGLMAFENNDIDSILATLQEPYEDMERRILVSTMVQDAVTKGFLKALEEEASNQLSAKDIEIHQLNQRLTEKDTAASDLKKVLEMREHEFPAISPGHSVKGSTQVWEFLHKSQQNWRASEVHVQEKEKELTKLASSMAHMATILDNESKRAEALDKQLSDLREQDSVKTAEISKLCQEIEKLKVDNARLKRQARLKELKYNENIERLQAEKEKQSTELERVLAEKKDVCRTLEEKNVTILDLQENLAASSQANRDLEAKLRTTTDEMNRLLAVEQNSIVLAEQLEEKKLMQEAEGEILTILLEQQIIELRTELAQWMETSTSFHRELENTRRRADNLREDNRENEALVARDILEEFGWKFDLEAVILTVILEGWHKEVTEVVHGLKLELAVKDDEILCCDKEVNNMKQAMEELGKENATLMSICLNLMRDRSDTTRNETKAQLGELDCGRDGSIELSGLLKTRELTGGQEVNSTTGLQLLEQLAGHQLQHDISLEIISEVFKQKYHEVINTAMASNFTIHGGISDAVASVCETVREAEGSGEQVNSSTKSLEMLEAQLDSFLELEACRLERIKSGCSTSISKCEFKLDNLMESLAVQVNEMKAKISFVQEAIKQQEWKHNVENEILVLVMLEAIGEMHRKLAAAEITQQVRSIEVKPLISPLPSEYSKSLPVDLATTKFMAGAVSSCLDAEDEHKRQGSPKSPLGIQDKDKLTYSLRREIEELRKEKAEAAQKLDDMTEQLYSLKRHFWKEKEIWISKLSQPSRKDTETLSRNSSMDLEEEFRRLEAAQLELSISKLREEWQIEREGLLEAILQKEMDLKRMATELGGLEKSSGTKEAHLLACIAELEVEKGELQAKKEHMAEELAKLVEQEKGHITIQARLLGRIAELETENESLTLARLHLESSLSKARQEWQIEKEGLVARIIEGQQAIEDEMSKLSMLSEKEKFHVQHIAQLETEKENLITRRRHKESPATSLLEEKEIALALAIKEREEEEKRRKILEMQLQGVRLEVKSLQGLNEEVACLKSKLESVPRLLELNIAEHISQSVKVSQEFEYRVTHRIQERIGSLDRIKEKSRLLKGHLKSYASRELYYKQKLDKELSNLQKAETEVDLLGDEVDSLLNLLEEVCAVFDLYAPVLQHYPRMTELAKIVKHEIQLRIDPIYGL